ncbi:DUF871 domain-containing protein [Beduini massiliensis]|uniref:DUF871 domain-containing protein n=1 Tax=Beduini massiliensis TaxID=1585974 RepID=UPI00059A85AF|nr:MupG family TIM beta-alpha barrel fold protein [Beduini massiliensis]
MGLLGISIYPEHSTLEKDKAYLDLAAKYGFKRVFTCLLSVDKPKEEVKNEFKELIGHANDLGMEVIVDVAPSVFDKLGITYDDLSFFKEIGAAGFRLDEGFNGAVEARMTYNPEGLKIELNAGDTTYYIDQIMANLPDVSKLISCHNFYPQRYTGVGEARLRESSMKMKKYGIKVAAFVSSQAENTYGPWDVYEGLCTLEAHRDLPIDAQARHLFATGYIDDVIIANAYATEEELRSLSEIDQKKLTLGIVLNEGLCETEKTIIFDYPNNVRGDMSEYMARSTMPRVVYKDESIKPHHNTTDLKRGDVVILNDLYGHYKGELHIILQDMPADERKNIVGHIPEYEMCMMQFVLPRVKFKFKEVKE